MSGSTDAAAGRVRSRRRDPFWPAQLTVLAAIALSLDLPSSLTIRKVWLIPRDRGGCPARARREHAVGRAPSTAGAASRSASSAS